MATVQDQPVKSKVVQNKMKYQARDYQEAVIRRDQIRTAFVKFDRTDAGRVAIDDLNQCLSELNFSALFESELPRAVSEQIIKAGFSEKKSFTFAEFTTLHNLLVDCKLAEVRQVEHKGKTLEDCCRDGDAESVKHLIEKGADVDRIDSGGNLPIIIAAVRGFLAICLQLLEAGADACLLRCERQYLLDLVRRKNLYKTKLGVEKIYGRVLYERAELAAKCQEGTIAASKEEFSRRPFSNSSDFGNWKGRPAFEGARPDYVRPTKIMFEKKKRVFTKEELRNGLIGASKMGRLDEIKKWVENGADVNCRDELGNTPLILCAWGGEIAVSSFLVEAGASVELMNFRGNSVLHICAETCNKELFKYFGDNGGEKIAGKPNVIGYTHEEVTKYNTDHPDE